MDLAMTAMRQVFVLFILMFAGFAGVKTGLIRMEGKKAFSDLLVNLICPCMILNSYFAEFQPEIFRNLLWAYGVSLLLILVGLAVTVIFTKKFPPSERPIQQFACIYSNAAFMGFPLIQVMFGEEGLLYASAYVTVFNILLWTHGYIMLSKGREGKSRREAGGFRTTMKKLFTTPVLISVMLGLVIYLGRIPLPGVLAEPIKLISGMNTPMAMFITGMIIADSNLGKIIRNVQISAMILLRLILIPLVCFGIYLAAGFTGMQAQVVFLLEACPCAAITSVFAVQFGYNEEMAAGSVVVTTLLSIITLPLWAGMISMI